LSDYIAPEEMADLERKAAAYGMGVGKLMENAGKAVADVVLERFRPRSVAVVCGAGNNGGDGFVAARYLSKKCRVRVVLLTSPENIRTEEAKKNWAALSRTKAEVFAAEDVRGLGKVEGAIADSEVIVAAIFGTGVKGGVVREPYASAIEMVNRSSAVKVAVDLPSGIDPATGEPSSPSIRADLTVALHRPKLGLKGREEFTGEVVVVPIGIREE